MVCSRFIRFNRYDFGFVVCWCEPNDTVECVVVVEDPSGASDQQSSSVTVLNTNPTIDVLTLSPAEPTLNDSLSCYAESSDVDGDTPTLSFFSPIKVQALSFLQQLRYQSCYFRCV